MAMVCLCHGVNERRVRREIEHGASTIDEIAAQCRAGSDCFGCHPTIDDLLAAHATVTPVAARRFRLA